MRMFFVVIGGEGEGGLPLKLIVKTDLKTNVVVDSAPISGIH